MLRALEVVGALLCVLDVLGLLLCIQGGGAQVSTGDSQYFHCKNPTTPSEQMKLAFEKPMWTKAICHLA